MGIIRSLKIYLVTNSLAQNSTVLVIWKIFLLLPVYSCYFINNLLARANTSTHERILDPLLVEIPDPLLVQIEMKEKQLLKLLLTIINKPTTQKLLHILKPNLVEMTRSPCSSFESTFETSIWWFWSVPLPKPGRDVEHFWFWQVQKKAKFANKCLLFENINPWSWRIDTNLSKE